jgi:hypothetical protein
MESLLSQKYEFTQIHKLMDADATRERILGDIRKYLIDEAAAGDICVFYYSGHGSRVRDTANHEEKGYDESIVPADSNKGARDIRDKELRELFLRAIHEKHVVLTLVFDSCHSGSIARGGFAERARSAPFCERDVAKEPDFKAPSFGPRESPESEGALVLSAAQDFEQANERTHDGAWRGNFTWALTEVLKQPVVSENEPAEGVFRRVVSMMEGSGVRELPVIAGTTLRRKAPIFGGSPVSGWNSPIAYATRRDGKQVWLEGGLAVGVGEGSVLKKQEPGGERDLLIEVTRLVGLNGCEAVVTAGDEKSVKEGTPFVIDKWVPRQGAILKVWIPPAVGQSEVKRLAGELAVARDARSLKLVEDPTETAADVVVNYEDTGWTGLGLQGRKENLGKQFTTSRLASAFSASAPIFVNIPPPDGLKQAIKVGEGTPYLSIEVTARVEDADYILGGRLKADHVEYAWIRYGATAEDPARTTDPLPPKEAWVSVDWSKYSIEKAGTTLQQDAITLSRVKGWMQIQAPATEGFPYRLALRKKGSTELIEGDRGDRSKGSERQINQVYEGETYRLLLIANQQELDRIKNANQLRQLYVYVFSIDRDGCSYLLYPKVENGGVENKLPIDPSNPGPEIELPPGVKLEEPFGFDTYIMLASVKPVKDSSALQFCKDDYRSKGARGAGDDSPLGQLLDIGGGTRGATSPAPTDWAMDRMHLRSVGRSQR